MMLTVDTDKLNKHMTLKGFTQVEVAERLEMSRQAISKILTGQSAHPRTVKRVAELLDLSTKDVWVDRETA